MELQNGLGRKRNALMTYHEMLPPEILALQQELKNWPMISEEAQATKSIEECLGTIAARLGILLDGMYDVPKLCEMLTKRLYEMRTTAIYVPSTELTEVRIKEGANEIVIEDVPVIELPKKAD
jgi:hypothetical protein